MRELSEILLQTPLFYGITPQELDCLLQCLNAKHQTYEKGQMLLWEGDTVQELGIILEGTGRAFKTDVHGRVLTVTLLETGSVISILLAAGRNLKSPVSIQATDSLRVLFMSFDKIIGQCSEQCLKHNLLLRNYLSLMAERALDLYDRTACLTKPSVREKILAYLSRMAQIQESKTFNIPMDRVGMAEYLNVERSALSRELSAMKKEGLLDYYKNSFSLHYFGKENKN